MIEPVVQRISVEDVVIDVPWSYQGAAAYFEGEGTINIRRRGVELVVESTDLDVLFKLNAAVGGRGRISGPRIRDWRKPTYYWRAASHVVVMYLLTQMIPYFGVRRRTQARTALKFLEEKPWIRCRAIA